MEEDTRLVVVDALARLAYSDDPRDRAVAGRCLAGFAESPEARAVLANLVLDARDSNVSMATAEALLRRKDRLGLALVAAAWAVADSDCAEELGVAVQRVFILFADDRDTALRQCQELAADPAQPGAVRAGTDELITELVSIDPLLKPP